MSKLGIAIVFSLVPLVFLGQQPAISVESFEYIWSKYLTDNSGRDNLRDEELQKAVTGSFKNAIQQRWNVELPEPKIKFRPLGAFSRTPKFDTKLKSAQPGRWYLFLQIFEDPYRIDYKNGNNPRARLKVKCKMIDYKDSVVFERNLTMIMNVEEAPPTEVRLTKLVAHPQEFGRTFEIMARWLFGPEDVSEKEVWLKPACLYTEKQSPSEPISFLEYKATDSTLYLVHDSTFCFYSSPMESKKTKTNNKTGGNLAGSFLTALTGIGTTETTIRKYDADFTFTSADSIVYHFKIPYVETITAERTRETTRNSDGTKSREVITGPNQLQRQPDSLAEGLVMKGNDTIAHFTIDYFKTAEDSPSYTKMWNGSDTATIVPLKNEWRNDFKQDEVLVQIKTRTDSIYLKSSVEKTVKQFSTNQKTVLIIYGAKIPSSGVLLHPVSKSDLELFTLFASLPYNYFNVGPK